MTDSIQLTIAILTLIATGITSIATLAMSIANFCTLARMKKQFVLTEQQLAESRRQYEETQRLQMMPYLQLRIEDAKKNDPGESEPKCIILYIGGEGSKPTCSELRYVNLINVGLGTLHKMVVNWRSPGSEYNNVFGERIAVPSMGEWGINMGFCIGGFDPKNDDELFHPNCRFEIEYDDLLGNRYHQTAELEIHILDNKPYCLACSTTPPECV